MKRYSGFRGEPQNAAVGHGDKDSASNEKKMGNNDSIQTKEVDSFSVLKTTSIVQCKTLEQILKFSIEKFHESELRLRILLLVDQYS